MGGLTSGADLRTDAIGPVRGVLVIDSRSIWAGRRYLASANRIDIQKYPHVAQGCGSNQARRRVARLVLFTRIKRQRWIASEAGEARSNQNSQGPFTGYKGVLIGNGPTGQPAGPFLFVVFYLTSAATCILMILSGSVTEPLSDWSPRLMPATKGMPSVTLPQTVYLLSSHCDRA